MRNLRLLRNISVQNASLIEANKYYIVNANECGDFKSTRIQCFTISDNLKGYRHQICNNAVERSDLIIDLCKDISELDGVTVVDLTHLFNYLYIILSDGHFFTALLDGEDIEVKKNRLSFSSIKYVSWSPDINRTAIVDSKDTLFVLHISDNSYKILSEISLQNDSEEQNSFVNVGWGSIETQFRGTEGKFSKSKPIESAVEEDHGDLSVNISWKHNSTSFAVSYLCKSTRTRRVKIFNQDGVLLNATKDIRGLYPAFDWCPSKNLISVVQKLPNKRVVSFLEQNALKHGDFQIKDGTEVIELRWNTNGEILLCHEKDQENEVISLWTTSNYKWYLKQCLVFSNHIAYVQWDFDVPKRLHVILDNGIYRMYEWTSQIIESNQHNKNANSSLVAVINDSQLNLTPYGQVYQPPSIPYEAYSAPLAINAVVFPDVCKIPELSNNPPILLYLSNNKCTLFDCKETVPTLYSFNFGDTNTEIEFQTPSELSTWLWLYPSNLYFSWSRVDGNYFCVSHLDVKTKSIIVKDMIKLDSVILAIASYESDIIVHTENGALYVLHNDLFLPMKISLVEPWIQFQTVNSELLIGLSEFRNLYINENIKWRDVLCFYWKPPFLVLIKMSNQLLITKVDMSGGDIKFSEVLTRQIEQKSSLVTVVDDQVILEMERGNLETIRPRPFSIFKMEQMLRDDKYYEAFKLLRKQRINLNVIFDHNPQSFLRNVKNIVEKVPDPMYLSTFVTELVDENVAKNMFPWKYGDADVTKDKVDLICGSLIDSIKEYDVKKLISPLIAALVRQGELTEAAAYAIKYDEIANLCTLVDPIAVYKAALASYDITCALKIVQHSKLDPSEYLPFIRELQETEENYRKFKICNYLENYDEALKHIAVCPDKFDECIAYIHKHCLYSNAVEVFSKENKSTASTDFKRQQVMTVVADFYSNNRLFDEASILYEKAEAYEKAFECYLVLGDWHSAISTYTMMDDKIPIAEVYDSLYKVLLKQGRYADAAFIAFNYSKNCRQAVDSFLMAKKYCNALNAAKGLKCDQIVESTIHPHLLSEVKSTIEHLQSDTKTIQTYTQRLYHLREKKRNKENGIKDDGESSVYSFATSTTTESTDSLSSLNSRTSMSSSAKRLRRQERKLWNLKKGNPREEPSLVATLKDTFTVADKLYPELLADLSKALIRMDEMKLARALKVEYSQFIKFLHAERDRIWPVNELTEDGGFKDISIRCPPDINSSNGILKLL